MAAITIAAALAPGANAQSTSVEYAVKANYLYKFAPFVEWPPRAFATSSSDFDVCVIGADPFGAVLDEAVRGQSVDGRALRVRRLGSVSAADGCHVVYISASLARPEETLRALRGSPVLTVAEDRSGLHGAIVRFQLRDGRVRFALDLAAAQANGLVISSKLQALALSTAGRGG